jgi:DUF4097 and DUF4098 domain-containing protein YvlB
MKGMGILMKKGFHKRITVLLFLLAAGTLFTGCGFRYVAGWGTNFLDRDDAKEFEVQKAVVEPITSIDIQTRMADVELIEADDFYVEIDYLYWDQEPEYSIEDGKLVFDDSDALPDSYSINFNMKNTIKIYLPKVSALTSLNIENASGDVAIGSFVADDMNITVSYGDLTVKEAAAIDADITLSSGTSRVSDFQVSKLDFTNSYGNAKFTDINTNDQLLPSGTSLESIDIEMSSGDITLKGLNTSSLTIDNSYGDIECENLIAEKLDLDLSSGDLDVKSSDIKDIEVSDSYGDVTLRLPGPDTDYSLDLTTSYGDITVGDKDYDENVVIDNGGTRSITADLSSGDVTVSFQ